MELVSHWARTEETPIPRAKIVEEMKKRGYKGYAIINAINALIEKGYIRKAVIISNKTYYVQLRGYGGG